jgi:hypothetical protein
MNQLRILWTDQAEYYFVCADCYAIHRDRQWSGSTRGRGDWRGRALRELEAANREHRECEFCGVQDGNGGWMDDEHKYPSAEKRDAKRAKLSSNGQKES